MKVSFKTANMHTDWAAVRDVWRIADDIDVFTGGWVFDHFMSVGGDEDAPCLEGWVLLSALAAVTSRLRIGVMVSGNTYRHPAVLAQMAATLDVISDGRLEVGIGTGWHTREHEAYGIELPPLRERSDRFDEAVEVIHLLLTEATATFDGAHYQLREAHCEPKPVQHPRPPIVIGGGGEKRTLRTTARWADHWNLVVRDMDLEPFRRKLDVLARWCETFGRSFDAIEKSAQIHAEDPASLADRCARLAEAGADHVIIVLPPPHRVEDLEAVAEAAREVV